MATTDRRARLVRSLPSVVAAALPWSWFAVRDRASLLDVVATGLPVVAAGLAAAGLVLAAVTRRRAPLAAAASVAAMGAVAVFGPWLPEAGPDPATPVRVVVANAFAGNRTPAEAAADIRAQDAGLVVVVEVPRSLREALRDDYRYDATGPTAEHLLLSRFPVRHLSGLPGAPVDGRVSRWEVLAPSGRVVVYSVHLRRPRPREGAVRAPLLEQRQMVTTLLAAVRAEDDPTLVVGDFNFSDRTWAYRRLTGPLRDAGRSTVAGPTFVSTKYRPFLLRIDHFFVSPDWCSARSARFTITGSDHRGVVADVGPCPG